MNPAVGSRPWGPTTPPCRQTVWCLPVIRLTEHVSHGQASFGAAHRPGLGMKIMCVMMAICFGGTVVLLLEPIAGLAYAIPLGIILGVAFGGAGWVYHRWMGPLMGICCGGAVFAGALPAMTIVNAGLVGAAAGVVIGFASHYGLHRRR